MYETVLTFILAGSDSQHLLPLTANQTVAALPFGGIFRLIDFTVTNALNAQLRRIYVLTGVQSERLSSYIQTAGPHLSANFRWDCGEDLICLPPAPDLRQISEIMKGSTAEYALIVSGDQVYQMDYRKLLRSHVANRADVSSPAKGIYVLNRSAILQAGEFDVEQYPTTTAFTGYMRTIETVDDYYAANMDLLSGRTGFDPYSDQKLLQSSRFASQSKIALGARLYGCKVTGSIISAGVRVESEAVVENSILFPGSHIGPGAAVRNSIVAENAVVPGGTQIGTDCGVTIFAAVPELEPAGRQIRRRCARVATKSGLAVVR